MVMQMKSVILTALAAAGIAASAAASADATLLTLTNPPVETGVLYDLSFTATSSSTTLSVAGFQVPSDEYVTDNGVYAGGSSTNLLATVWAFTPAASGSDTSQYSDGTGVNALRFAGVTDGDYDTYSQTFSTTAGDTYTYKFSFQELDTGPSSLVVTTSGASAVPEPAAWALMLIGLVGLVGLAGVRGSLRGSQRKQFSPAAAT